MYVACNSELLTKEHPVVQAGKVYVACNSELLTKEHPIVQAGKVYVACSSELLTKEHPIVQAGKECSSCKSVAICETSAKHVYYKWPPHQMQQASKNPPTRTYIRQAHSIPPLQYCNTHASPQTVT